MQELVLFQGNLISETEVSAPGLIYREAAKNFSHFEFFCRCPIDKENGYDKAIKSCIKKGILKEYLLRKAKEIKNMLIADYDYATDIAVQREEALELGRQEGRQEGAYQKARETAQAFKKMGLSLSQIAKGTGLSEVEIAQLPCDDD